MNKQYFYLSIILMLFLSCEGPFFDVPADEDSIPPPLVSPVISGLAALGLPSRTDWKEKSTICSVMGGGVAPAAVSYTHLTLPTTPYV